MGDLAKSAPTQKDHSESSMNTTCINSEVNSASCIYCEGSGPFTNEHVISAGLGGDDNRFLLKDMVCEECNTKRFSPLELEFLRNSPIALARLFSQKQARKRGAKDNSPKLSVPVKNIIDKNGRPLEADFENGRAEILSQLIRRDEKTIDVTGRNLESFSTMLKACHDVFVESTVCAFKQRSDGKDDLISIVYGRDENSYVEKSRTMGQRIRGKYIWISLDDKIDTSPNHRTSLYQRMNGQIVLKTSSPDAIVESLNFFRKSIEQLNLESVQESDIVNPLVALSGTFSIDVIPRVFAKIAFNILAYLVPRKYLSRPQFSTIRQSILTGKPQLPYHATELTAKVGTILKRLTPEGHHSFLISRQPSSKGGFFVYVTAQLYGSFVEFSILGDSLPHPPILLPVLFLVDYNEHSIRRLEAHQFLVFHHALPKWQTSLAD